MKVALIAPTINEVIAMRQVFPKLDRTILDEIIVVDLNSTDGTVQYCQEHGYKLIRQTSRGYGGGLQEGIAATDADIIIEFPPDGSSMPEKIPALLAKINEGYDLVMASRYRDGAISYDDDFVTKFGNWLFTFIVNILFGGHYTDTLVGFRAYRRSALNKTHASAWGMSWAIQVPIRMLKIGARVGEIGADEPVRIGGVRKMRPLKTGWEILRVIIGEWFIGKQF